MGDDVAEDKITRKLTTILAADVKEYTRLMRADEESTLKTFSEYRAVIDGLISRHDGRVFSTAGDSVLAEFGSAVEAVRCAISFQEEISRRNAALADDRKVTFRIGINIGDVMVRGDDLLGDGVNVAARLEGLAEPGGIYISRGVFEQVKHKLSHGFEDMGRQEVKNIAEPVSAFRLVPGQVSVSATATAAAKSSRFKHWRIPAMVIAAVLIIATGGFAIWQPWKSRMGPVSSDKTALPLPSKPSIAVLPFANLSGDTKQDYLSDGITEDIITDLSKVSGLFVVARNSSFKFRDQSVDVRKVARDLGVRHVLNGSVRRSGNQLRITVQLIDADTGIHVWAERYDRKANDVFAIQDEIAAKVAAELAVTLRADEQERLFRRHTNSLKAYETFLRARRVLQLPTKERTLQGKVLFARVIELDPRFAGGYAGLSFTYAIIARHGLSATPQVDIKRALELAHRAISLDESFGWSYLALGGAYLINGAHDQAVATMREAIRVQPSDADAHLFLGNYLHWAGRGEEAIGAIRIAMRLNPKPRSGRQTAFLSQAYFTAKRYKDTIATLVPHYAASVRRGTPSLAFIAAAYAATGQNQKARTAMKALLDKHARHTLANFRHARLYKKKEDLDHYLMLLRKAGMPE